MVAEKSAESFVIEGGRPLNGRVRAAGNKNGALPILAATLLASEPVTLSNVPRIRDVETMVELLDDLGAEVEWIGPNEVTVDATHRTEDRRRPGSRDAHPRVVPRRRTVDRALRPSRRAAAGRRRDRTPAARRAHPRVRAARRDGHDRPAFEFTGRRLRGKHVFLDEASVMGTENAVMAAVLAEGETVIGNAACEPHVQDLCRFLVSLGAQIEGIESNVLRIHGVERLGGGEYRIAPEHIEVASFIGLAAVTGGDLWIDETAPEGPRCRSCPHFARLGVRVEIDGTSVHVPPGPGAAGAGRPRRPDPEDRGRARGRRSPPT